MTRVCKVCNKGYELSESGAGYKYCSQYCSDEARRIRNRERWREANPGWDDGINRVCEWCGQAFTVPARNAHIDFHKTYGYGNNTKEQFKEFKERSKTI